jgi:hypothetical protein
MKTAVGESAFNIGARRLQGVQLILKIGKRPLSLSSRNPAYLLQKPSLQEPEDILLLTRYPT